jgi:predicted secreted protein
MLGDRGRNTFRVACVIQGLFNLAVLYFVFQIGIGLLNTSSLVIISGFDISFVVAIVVIVFGIYITPLMLYSGIVIPLVGLFQKNAPSIKLYHTMSNEEMHALVHDFYYGAKFKSKLLDLMSEEDKTAMIVNKVTHSSSGEDKDGKYAEFFYRERINYEWKDIQDTEEWEELGGFELVEDQAYNEHGFPVKPEEK